VVDVALAGVTLGAFIFYLFRWRTMETVLPRVAATARRRALRGAAAHLVALLKRQGKDGGAWVSSPHRHLVRGHRRLLPDAFIARAWPDQNFILGKPEQDRGRRAPAGSPAAWAAMVLAKLWYLPHLG